MSDALDKRFDLDRLVGQRANVSGELTASRLRRVLELHELNTRDLTAELHLDGHAEGKIRVTGRIQGAVEVVCQRCLEPFEWVVDNKVALMVMDADQLSIEIPEGFEAFVPEQQSFTGIDIVEEELLLVLPMSPTHQDESMCGNLIEKINESRSSNDEAEDASEQSTRPFEILKQLKKH